MACSSVLTMAAVYQIARFNVEARSIVSLAHPGCRLDGPPASDGSAARVMTASWPRDDAARHRRLDPGRGGISVRQLVERAHREEGKGMRFQRVGRPADLVGGLDR